jgi:hypothetical protein
VLGPEAGPRDLDEVGTVRQAVERGRGKQRLAEQVRPFGPIAVAGQDDGGLLVAFVDDVVEIFGAGPAQRLQAEIVDLCGAPHNSTYGERAVMWSADREHEGGVR